MAKKSRTRDARARRQKQQRQNQQRMILIGIVVVAVLAIALVVVSNQPTEAFIPADLEARYEGLQTSLSIEGYPRLGDPDAPVTVEEYASFSCPGCEAFHSASFDAILERIRLGQVLFSYIPLQTGSIPNAQGAARTALCAGQQGQFWEMHDVLFDWHTRYGNTAFSQNQLLAGVSAMGMNGDSFTGCFNSQAISNTLDTALGEGVASTPTIDVNGVTLSSGTGGIPSTQELLTAIDNATPNDWTPGSADDDADAPVEETVEPTSDDTDTQAEETAEPTDDVADAQVEETAEPTNDATNTDDVSSDEESDETEETTEATEEAED